MHIIHPLNLIKHRQVGSKIVYPKLSFACVIYCTSKHICGCVGACVCDHTPLLKGLASYIVVASIFVIRLIKWHPVFKFYLSCSMSDDSNDTPY